MRARVTSRHAGRRERPSEWLAAHLETQPGREPGAPPPAPRAAPRTVFCQICPQPPPRALGGGGRGSGQSPRAAGPP